MQNVTAVKPNVVASVHQYIHVALVHRCIGTSVHQYIGNISTSVLWQHHNAIFYKQLAKLREAFIPMAMQQCQAGAIRVLCFRV